VSRVSQAQLLRLSAGLPPRERELLRVVSRLRVATHAQLASLLRVADSSGSAASEARSARRILARLTARGVLARLERRVGGVRAGSSGYVYYLGPTGQRLLAYWEGRGLVRGRLRPEPGGRWVRHQVAVSELYVQLRGADRAGELDLLGFDPEPDCWRRLADGFGGTTPLKPDAFVRVGIGAYEERCFVEVDLGSESRTVIRDKLRRYLDYFQAGDEQATSGVFPRIVLLTNSETRRASLVSIVGRLPAEHWALFTLTTLEHALPAMSGTLAAAGSGAESASGGWARESAQRHPGRRRRDAAAAVAGRQRGHHRHQPAVLQPARLPRRRPTRPGSPRR
jgi:hypothetical protein